MRIVNEFPNSAAAKKAAGAQTRLDSVGKTIVLRGQSPLGSPVDLAKYRGKVVLIQYWATWSVPAKADMATLKELWNKYGRSFVIVGVSLGIDTGGAIVRSCGLDVLGPALLHDLEASLELRRQQRHRGGQYFAEDTRRSTIPTAPPEAQISGGMVAALRIR